MNIICTTLNAKYIHTNLAIRYLKAYAQPEFDVELVEYTIKDPVLNIVTDLYRRKPDVVGFSCYIWNIEQTIEVVQLLKKVHPNGYDGKTRWKNCATSRFNCRTS